MSRKGENDKNMKTAMIGLLYLLLVISCGGGGSTGGGTPGGSSHSALCNDGTYSDSTNCSGTCSSHGGVREWYISCGSSPTSSILPMNDKSSNSKEQWTGTWTDDEANIGGTISLTISKDIHIEGAFYDKDNVLNGQFHSVSGADEDGIVHIFIDVQDKITNENIEYPAHFSYYISNNQLKGVFRIQKKEIEEIRKINLSKIIISEDVSQTSCN
jgi:hypothetical protein